MAVLAQFIFGLPPLRSRNHCWHTEPRGSWDWVGWRGSAKPCRNLQTISPNSPRAPPLHLRLPCSATCGWGDKSDQHPTWASDSAVQQGSLSPSWRAGMLCHVQQLEHHVGMAAKLQSLPNSQPSWFHSTAQYPLSSREVQMGIFITSQEHPTTRHHADAARQHLEGSGRSEPAGPNRFHVGSVEG